MRYACMIWERQGDPHWRGAIINCIGVFLGSWNGWHWEFCVLLLSIVSRGHGREEAERKGLRLLAMKCDFLGCAHFVSLCLMACCGEVTLCLT